MVWLAGKKAMCKKILNSLWYFETQCLRSGEGKHLRKTWFMAVSEHGMLITVTWNLNVKRSLIKPCCLSCGDTKMADFTSTHWFWFLYVCVFFFFFGPRWFSFIHIFRLKWLFWLTYFLFLKDIEEVELKLCQVLECVLWELYRGIFCDDALNFANPHFS